MEIFVPTSGPAAEKTATLIDEFLGSFGGTKHYEHSEDTSWVDLPDGTRIVVEEVADNKIDIYRARGAEKVAFTEEDEETLAALADAIAATKTQPLRSRDLERRLLNEQIGRGG